MNESVRMVVVLTVIAMVSAGILAQVYQVTSGIIEENMARELETSVYTVLPEAVSVRRLDTSPETLVEDDPEYMREPETQTTMIFVGYDAAENPIGYAFIGEANGYGGAVRVLVGVSDKTNEIVALAVLEHAETPGLGSRIEEAGFRDQFVGKSIDDPIELGRDIDGITGATISSRAVAQGVRRGFDEASAVYEGGN